MKGGKFVVLFVLIVFGYFGKSSAFELDTPSQIRIVTEHLPPYQIGKTGVLSGGKIGNKVMPIAKQLFPNVQIEVLPWARAYKLALSRPNTIIFSIVKTPERTDKFHWIAVVETVTTQLVAKSDHPISETQDLNDLLGLQVGVKRDDAVSSILLQHGFEYGRNMTDIISTVSTLQMLEKGRVDAVPSNEHVIKYYCQMSGCEPKDFKPVYTFKTLSEDFYIAASLGTDPNVLTALSDAFANLEVVD